VGVTGLGSPVKEVGAPLAVAIPVRGRITETHLQLAEIAFPGISEMYASLSEKPGTFLELVWLYEEAMQAVREQVQAPPRASTQVP
jgi:hypothetical protein